MNTGAWHSWDLASILEWTVCEGPTWKLGLWVLEHPAYFSHTAQHHVGARTDISTLTPTARCLLSGLV